MAYIPIYQIKLVKESRPASQKVETRSIENADAAAKVLLAYLEGADREKLVVLLLDARNRAIGLNTVSIGSLDSAIVSPREIFKGAILANCASIIVAHNHPSGEALPSDADKEVYKKLKEAGELLDIKLLDYLILGDNCYYTFDMMARREIKR